MMKFKRVAMLSIVGALLFVGLCGFQGCTSAPPKPNNAQTAVYEARYQLGIQEHMLNKFYLRAPDCTSPITTLPCKNFAVATSIQNYIKIAHATVDEADKTVNDPNFDASTSQRITTTLQGVIDLITGFRKDPKIAATMGKPTAADEAEAKAEAKAAADAHK